MDTNRPFIMYANCTVEYDGRASSILEQGNYLIIYKSDGSFQIHGNNLIKPLNYQPSGTVLETTDNYIICKRKKETIKINILQKHNYMELNDWSTNNIKLIKTEEELKQKLINNISEYFPEYSEVHNEYKTKYGNIDILVVDKQNQHHIIEVKRNKITINNCSQLLKYLGYFNENKINNKGYLAGPEIAKNAETYIKERGIGFIKITWDTHV